VIEWGDGIYGAEAAARTYFGIPASSLGPTEAALLAGAIVNPRLLSPANPTKRLRNRQRLILARMNVVRPPTDLPPPAADTASGTDMEAEPAEVADDDAHGGIDETLGEEAAKPDNESAEHAEHKEPVEEEPPPIESHPLPVSTTPEPGR